MTTPIDGLGLSPHDRVAVVGGYENRAIVAAIAAAGCTVGPVQDDTGAPFTAPAPFDLIPDHGVTVVVSVIGAGALGRVIADRCHRPLRIAALAGCSPYRRLTPAAAATVLLHSRGARAAGPQARLAVAMLDLTDANRVAAGELAAELRDREPGLAVVSLDRGPERGDQGWKSNVAISRS